MVSVALCFTIDVIHHKRFAKCLFATLSRRFTYAPHTYVCGACLSNLTTGRVGVVVVGVLDLDRTVGMVDHDLRRPVGFRQGRSRSDGGAFEHVVAHQSAIESDLPIAIVRENPDDVAVGHGGCDG